MIVVMFAQVLAPGASLSNSPRAVRIQVAVFGVSMLVVAAYVVLS